MFICVESVLATKQSYIVFFAVECCWGVFTYMILLFWFQFRQNDEGKEKEVLLNATNNTNNDTVIAGTFGMR